MMFLVLRCYRTLLPGSVSRLRGITVLPCRIWSCSTFLRGFCMDIARLFTLADWVQGPARACRLLRRMKLTSIDLTCPIYKWVRPD